MQEWSLYHALLKTCQLLPIDREIKTKTFKILHRRFMFQTLPIIPDGLVTTQYHDYSSKTMPVNMNRILELHSSEYFSMLRVIQDSEGRRDTHPLFSCCGSRKRGQLWESAASSKLSKSACCWNPWRQLSFLSCSVMVFFLIFCSTSLMLGGSFYMILLRQPFQ